MEIPSSTRAGVYELRTYTVVPSKMGELLQLTKEQFHLRTAHSEMLGYWTPEIGGLNQVIHIWHYDSLEHRTEVRLALSKDKKWISEFASKAVPFIQTQDNSLMLPISRMPVTESVPAGKGIYELQVVEVCGTQDVWELPVRNYAAALATTSGGALVGAWQTVIGRLNQVVLLVRYSNMDAALQEKKQTLIYQDGLEEGAGQVIHCITTKLLLPHSVSPMQ